jgi:hypothetical protein
MSAIKTLKAQATAQQATPVVDLSIRHLLAKALTDSGKFEAVNTKMDSRRGSLSVKVRGARYVRNAETLVSIAAKAGLTIQARLTTSDYAEAGFKIEQLVITADLKGQVPASLKTTQIAQSTANKLVSGLQKTAPVYNGSTAITLAGVSLGYVSQEAADKIKAIVADDQKPKVQQVNMVNLNTNTPEAVMMPTVVAQAIIGKVPSYNSGEWSVKSTSAIVIVRHAKTNGHWVVI